MLSPCICGAATGRHLLARKRRPHAQPRSTFGSPEDLIDRGTAALARQTERLGRALARATEGHTTPRAILAAIDRAAKRYPRERLADPLEREFAHAAWLGALDSDFEARENRPVALPSFAALHAPLLLKYDKSKDPAFSTRPQGEARKEFEAREPVTRDVYDAMSDAARRRAVTVANATSAEVVRSVKRELVQQVAQGADLADFKGAAVKRLEQAGWTPANPSHVENVLRTNVATAYNAGRYRQMTQPGVLKFRPYFQIMTVNDGPPRQRPTHQAVHLVVLRADDPFWLHAYPPFGYQCRCRVRSLGIREGEKLVVSGSTIRDLPDKGFTSGIAQLDVPPVPPIPPANDILPPPANDVLPPGPVPPPPLPPANDVVPVPPPLPRPKPPPRKPRAPKPPKPKPTADDGFTAHGIVVDVEGTVPEEMKAATLRGFETAGLGKGGSKYGPANGYVVDLHKVEMTDKVDHSATLDEGRNDLPRGTGGVYWGPRSRRLRVGTDAAHIDPFLRRRTIADYAGKRNVPANTSNIAQSPEQVVEMTACHEYAHHIHISSVHSRRTDAAPDTNDAADVLIFNEFKHKDRQAVSYYSEENREEFWAESLTAYRYYPRAWMRANAPRTLSLVRKVLKLKGLK
jgi:SPP1 gp7 family putative phage head morphogenesis protein